MTMFDIIYEQIESFGNFVSSNARAELIVVSSAAAWARAQIEFRCSMVFLLVIRPRLRLHPTTLAFVLRKRIASSRPSANRSLCASAGLVFSNSLN